MTEFDIPAGKAIPLVDETTKLFPAPTMDALDALYAGGGASEPIIYPDLAALDDVLTNEVGFVYVDDLSAWTGEAAFTGFGSWVLVQTVEGLIAGSTLVLSQYALAVVGIGMSRDYVGVQWNAWQESHPVYMTDFSAATGLLLSGVGPNAGSVSTVPMSVTPEASTVAVRNVDGQIGVGDPADATHATPMGYVDTALEGKVTGLNGATGVWIGTEAELPPEPRDPTVVYFVI